MTHLLFLPQHSWHLDVNASSLFFSVLSLILRNIKIFGPVFLWIEREVAPWPPAACIFGWLMRMWHFFVRAHYCLESGLFSARRHQTAMRPLPLFLRVSVLVRSTLEPIPRQRGDLAQVKMPFGDSLLPSSIWAHTSSPPLLSSLILLYPRSKRHHSSSLQPSTLEDSIKHDCNYNQAHSLSSASYCPSLSTKDTLASSLHYDRIPETSAWIYLHFCQKKAWM